MFANKSFIMDSKVTFLLVLKLPNENIYLLSRGKILIIEEF